LFFKQLKNPVVYILVVSSIIAFVLSEKLDGWAILSIVILNSIIGYLHEAKAEASLEALSALTTPKTRVLRDGKSVLIESKLIVPGDILIFEAGDYVAADARVFSAHQLMADESILTGESTPVTKVICPLEETLALADRVNMVFASTVISGGSGRAVVTHTGEKTEIGKISEMMDATEVSHTPLQKRLQSVSNKLILLGICVVVLVVIIELLKGSQFIEIVMTALSLSIAAIPEGLPTVVTLALVMGIRRMSKKKALVRKLDSVETLGATDIICTDKTGTLTTGHMVVREFFTLDLESERLVYPILIMCNNASLEGGGNGDSTEVALLEFVAKKVSTQEDDYA
jgi:Ca2+-transporting ATPase